MYRKHIHTLRKLKQKFDANGNLSAVTRLANAIIVVAAQPMGNVYRYVYTHSYHAAAVTISRLLARVSGVYVPQIGQTRGKGWGDGVKIYKIKKKNLY